MNPVLLTLLLLPFSSCTFITESSNPRLHAHFINAFSPVFSAAHGKSVMRNLLEVMDMSNPQEWYLRLASTMTESPNVDPEIFESMLFAMPIFHRIKGIEDIIMGAENVFEEASRMCFFVLEGCKGKDDDGVELASEYLFTVSSIYLRNHPNFPVVPMLIKLKNVLDSLEPTPGPFVESKYVRGISLLKMLKGRELIRKYVTDLHTRANTDILHIVQIARIEDYRNRFTGLDPAPGIAEPYSLPKESKIGEFLKSALDHSILKIFASGSEEAFSFRQDAYTPLLSFGTYLEQKVHSEHPGDAQLHIFDMWSQYCSFLKNTCHYISIGRAINPLSDIKFREMLDKKFIGLEKLKIILKEQMWICLFALEHARLPIINASSLEEYAKKLPVWLRELRKKMVPKMFPKADAFLCEELNLVADLMNLDPQKREDLIFAARYIVGSK